MEEQSRRESIHPSKISDLKPLTHEAYGGGMYGKDDVKDCGGKRDGGGGEQGQRRKPPASETQSADGISEPSTEPKHKPPPSTGDRDLDITGLSYIQ